MKSKRRDEIVLLVVMLLIAAATAVIYAITRSVQSSVAGLSLLAVLGLYTFFFGARGTRISKEESLWNVDAIQISMKVCLAAVIIASTLVPYVYGFDRMMPVRYLYGVPFVLFGLASITKSSVYIWLSRSRD